MTSIGCWKGPDRRAARGRQQIDPRYLAVRPARQEGGSQSPVDGENQCYELCARTVRLLRLMDTCDSGADQFDHCGGSGPVKRLSSKASTSRNLKPVQSPVPLHSAGNEPCSAVMLQTAR